MHAPSHQNHTMNLDCHEHLRAYAMHIQLNLQYSYFDIITSCIVIGNEVRCEQITHLLQLAHTVCCHCIAKP